MKTELQSLYIRLTNELKEQKKDGFHQRKSRKENIETLRESIKIINKENKRKFN